MQNHSLTVKGGVKAVSNPTEHGHSEVKPDVVVECLLMPSMIIAEWAESGIQGGQISAPIYSDILFSGHPAHGELGHQVMETDVLVLPMIPFQPVYDFAITFLNHPDKELRLYNWVTLGKHPGWSIAVQALGNHCPYNVCFLFLAVFLEQVK